MAAERRAAELAEKRAKLAALKSARLAREQASSARPSPTATRPSSTAGDPSSSALTSSTRADEIDRLLSGVGIGSASGASTLGGGSPAASPSLSGGGFGLGRSTNGPGAGVGEGSRLASSVGVSGAGTSVSESGESGVGDGGVQAWAGQTEAFSPGPLPSFTSTSTEIYDLPPQPKVFYHKSVQTVSFDDPASTSTSTSTSTTLPAGPSGGASSESIDALRARLFAELEQERIAVDAEIAEEKRKAEEALAAERARGLPEAQLQKEFASAAFVDFLAASSKVVERALSDSYDYLRDYTVAQDGGEVGEGAKVRLLGSWYEEKWARGRSVTGVDWSPKFPELFAASYNKNPLAVNEPDGVACVWNLHLQDRPEFVFHSQSDVLSVAFSPFHPNLVIGGTYSGQILLWDTRSRHPNPVLKTPLSASGHTHPVYSLSLVGTQNAHNLISASTDGTVCAWTLDLLARPQETLDLVLAGTHHKTDEVSVTALGFPEGETATFWVGTEEGNVYSAQRYDRAGSKAGVVQGEVYKGHSGPVTALDFHPVAGPVDLSDLFLTSGVDWTVKLWRAGAAGAGAAGAGSKPPSVAPSPAIGSSSSGSRAGAIAPLLSFEESNDYVYDVMWHPHHPALFGSVDGAGKFDVWNLNQDTEVPTVSTAVAPSAPRGLNRLAWDRKEGRKAAVGSSDGRVHVYELAQELITPREGEWEQMARLVRGAATAGPAADLSASR